MRPVPRIPLPNDILQFLSTHLLESPPYRAFLQQPHPKRDSHYKTASAERYGFGDANQRMDKTAHSKPRYAASIDQGLRRPPIDYSGQSDSLILDANDRKEIRSNNNEKPFKTIFDIQANLAESLAGSLDSGLDDLSTNKKHFEGFGTKEGEKKALLKRNENNR